MISLRSVKLVDISTLTGGLSTFFSIDKPRNWREDAMEFPTGKIVDGEAFTGCGFEDVGPEEKKEGDGKQWIPKKSMRTYRCNRPKRHSGDHVEINRRSIVLHRWPNTTQPTPGQGPGAPSI